MITVKQGGFARYSAQIAAAETNAWSAGRLLTLDTSGEVNISTGVRSGLLGVGVVVGVGGEDRKLATSIGLTTTLTKIGAPTGAQASMVLDIAVIETDQIQSGVAIAPGDQLYASSTGYVTTSGNGTVTNNMPIGVALTLGRAGDGARPVTMLFNPSY